MDTCLVMNVNFKNMSCLDSLHFDSPDMLQRKRDAARRDNTMVALLCGEYAASLLSDVSGVILHGAGQEVEHSKD